MSGERQLSIWTALGLWAAAVAGAALYGAWHGYSGRAYVFTLCVLAFFLAIQLLLAAGNLGERFARRAGSLRGVLIAIVPFLAYLIYLAGTNSFTWWRAAFAAAYTLTPVLLTISAGKAKAGAWQDYLAMLAIFLPLKMRLLNALWPYGEPKIGTVATILLPISVALATFLFVRQFDGVGYNIVWGRNPMFTVLLHFGLLAVFLIPLGSALHFIRFDPSQAHWKSLPADAIFIFLLTAWPEELLFRGLLQNSLSRTLASETGGWITASVVFGLAHITNNGVFPNWRYSILATIAGIFYGRTWRKTNSIFASAIVHALIDTIWHLAFRTL
jgi:membrane protease YdiL (CAAX protease family)